MKAVQLIGYGDIDQLVYHDVPVPEPGPGEVLVKVRATSVNPIDWKLRSGAMKAMAPLQFPFILGRDVAGEVENTGRKVMGLVNHSYAEYLVSKEQDLADLPSGLAMEDAGALPLVLLTGSQLVERGVAVKAGQTILVTGALGSVARAAVYVIKEHGGRVIAGVRASQKAEAAKLGADQVVALDDDSELQALPELDGIADTVGGEVIQKLLAHVKQGGVIGSVLGPVKDADKHDLRVGAISAQPDAARLYYLATAVREGKLEIPISKRVSLNDVGQAQKAAEEGHSSGKIVIIP